MLNICMILPRIYVYSIYYILQLYIYIYIAPASTKDNFLWGCVMDLTCKVVSRLWNLSICLGLVTLSPPGALNYSTMLCCVVSMVSLLSLCIYIYIYILTLSSARVGLTLVFHECPSFMYSSCIGVLYRKA